MRGIHLLHPAAQTKARLLETMCRQKEIPLLITETWRTVSEQDALYARGRTAAGSIVTNARGSSFQSGHQWGVAFDFCRNVRGREFDNSDGFFETVGALGKSIGLIWGGDWRSPDRPHFELPEYMPRSSTAMLRERYGTPEDFKANWNKAPEASCDVEEILQALRRANLVVTESHWRGVLEGRIKPNPVHTRKLIGMVIDTRSELQLDSAAVKMVLKTLLL
jgi:peptidoglycan L-alanyl-D-glutamate endopeptidase CwlK